MPGKAESEAVRSDNIASRERKRADKAEDQIKEMLDIPEIKKFWESIQQNKRNFERQLDQLIGVILTLPFLLFNLVRSQKQVDFLVTTLRY